MPANPVERPGTPVRGAQARVPSLGRFLFQVREARGLSRRQARLRTTISETHIRDIEKGDRAPSPELLQTLIAGYQLSDNQARHARELLAPPLDLTPTETLRAQIQQHPRMLDYLDYLDNERGILAAYTDPLINLLAVNDRMERAFPRLREVGNVAPWIFDHYSEGVLTDRDNEKDQVVALLKAAMGVYRETPQTAHLLRRLRPCAEFNRYWTTRTRIAYGRDTTDYLRWRDQATGEHVAAYISSMNVEVKDVLLYLAVPVPDPVRTERS
ncbi:helix-turn-helix domain-containing protein [Nocardia sp. CDC159]|uniref:Helix-turn-helix domain-containing protein n=1 Tax=Nocardia pulmonis TaxID=2951408 RepID=A0A9X2E5X7_9NOCA|nr:MULTISPECIES: helix-turn-helix domain-containing protein [Nocardia]MCM6774409.1 helix-turn-helix domain-containing protein [Nocardia pulmonis]MCM6787525.1 helix-turn-helix domain-containing protein [Nocardia sp. CDC159]